MYADLAFKADSASVEPHYEGICDSMGQGAGVTLCS